MRDFGRKERKERKGLWFGDVPQTWSVGKMRTVVYERREKYNRNEELMILSLLKDVGVIPYSEKGNIGNKSKDDHTQYKVARTGDLVINSMNIIIGSVGITPYNGYISPAYYSFVPRSNTCMGFIGYLCSTRKFQKAARCYAKGIMEIRLRISAYDFLSMPIPLPPLPEQEAIVKYLDAETAKIDKAIAAEEKMIALLQERREIIINDAVGGGDFSHAEAKCARAEGVGLPEREARTPKGPRGAARGGGWAIKRFKSLFSTCTGISFTKAELVEDGCPVLSYGQIHSKENSGVGVNRKLIRHIPAAMTLEKSLAYKGDFLFADTSEDLEGCGNCICIDTEEPIYAGSHVILARKHHEQIGRFLAYEFACISWRKQLRRLVNGVKVYSVTQTILNSVPVWIPPLPEQERIVKYLDAETGKIDRAIEVKRRQIALLRERREIVINEVVTGKVKVA